jgi:hypothetical protein
MLFFEICSLVTSSMKLQFSAHNNRLSEVKVTLRPTVSRLVRLDARRPSETRAQLFFLPEIVFRQWWEFFLL